jgi:hypothetical protein
MPGDTIALSDHRLVTLSGWTLGGAEEPFITDDDQYLVVNTQDDGGGAKSLHVLSRTGPTSFAYIGPLGTNEGVVDAAPSIDQLGKCYFVRTEVVDRKQVFRGTIAGGVLSSVEVVPGSFHPADTDPSDPLVYDQDVGVSYDGHSLYISRAHGGIPFPSSIQLIRAIESGGAFVLDPTGAADLAAVNAGGFTYAAHLSKNGCELWFTQTVAPIIPPGLYVSTRGSTSEPFGTPQHLVGGGFGGDFVEGIALGGSQLEAYYHQRNASDVSEIWVAAVARSGGPAPAVASGGVLSLIWLVLLGGRK